MTDSIRTEILHESPPPILIDIASLVAAAADVAVPVVAMSMVVDVPMSIPDMSIFGDGVPKEGEEAGMVQDWEACTQEWAFAAGGSGNVVRREKASTSGYPQQVGNNTASQIIINSKTQPSKTKSRPRSTSRLPPHLQHGVQAHSLTRTVASYHTSGCLSEFVCWGAHKTGWDEVPGWLCASLSTFPAVRVRLVSPPRASGGLTGGSAADDALQERRAARIPSGLMDWAWITKMRRPSGPWKRNEAREGMLVPDEAISGGTGQKIVSAHIHSSSQAHPHIQTSTWTHTNTNRLR